MLFYTGTIDSPALISRATDDLLISSSHVYLKILATMKAPDGQRQRFALFFFSSI
jgi:hypothetical protein